MAGEMFYTLWNYLNSAQYGQALIYTYNNYFPFGFIFWAIGFAIFIVTYKARNLAWAGAVASLYFLALSTTPYITTIYTRMAMRYFGIIIGIFTGYYIYKIMKG